jgi:hypothetical protein
MVILSEPWQAPVPPGCTILDAKSLAASGALAIDPGPDGPRIVTARDTAGDRIWNRAVPRERSRWVRRDGNAPESANAAPALAAAGQ